MARSKKLTLSKYRMPKAKKMPERAQVKFIRSVTLGIPAGPVENKRHNPFQSEVEQSNSKFSMSAVEDFNLLTSLPTGVAADIVTTWAGSAQYVVKTDTAFCNSRQRANWLELLSAQEFSMKWDVDKRTTAENVVWAIRRQVWLHSINFDERSSFELCEAYLTTRGERIRAIRLTAQSPDVRDRFLNLILVFCKNITHLRLQLRPRFTSLRDVFTQCTHLQEFSCVYDGEIKDSDLDDLVCPNLRSIQIESCRNAEFISAVAKMAVNLRAIHLFSCSVSSDQDTTFSVLRDISPHITSLLVTDACLDDAALVAVASKCSRLQHLCVSGSVVTDVGVCHAVQYLTHLQSLDLSKTQISDDSLGAIAAHCADTLVELKVLWCDAVYPPGINTIMERCTHVTSIGYDWFGGDMFAAQPRTIDFQLCSQLTSLVLTAKTYENIDIMRSIAANCKLLKHFTFHIYNLKTPTIFDTVVQKCTHLSVLSIYVGGQSNHFVYPKDIVRWQKMRPGLVVKRDFKATYHTWNVFSGDF